MYSSFPINLARAMEKIKQRTMKKVKPIVRTPHITQKRLVLMQTFHLPTLILVPFLLLIIYVAKWRTNRQVDADDNAVTIENGSNSKNSSLTNDILNEWNSIANEKNSTVVSLVDASVQNQMSEASVDDSETEVSYTVLLKDAVRAAYKMAEHALSSKEGKVVPL